MEIDYKEFQKDVDELVDEAMSKIHEGKSVKIIMINGYQMTGVIEKANPEWVTVISTGVRKHVHVNLISTIEEMEG